MCVTHRQAQVSLWPSCKAKKTALIGALFPLKLDKATPLLSFHLTNCWNSPQGIPQTTTLFSITPFVVSCYLSGSVLTPRTGWSLLKTLLATSSIVPSPNKRNRRGSDYDSKVSGWNRPIRGLSWPFVFSEHGLTKQSQFNCTTVGKWPCEIISYFSQTLKKGENVPPAEIIASAHRTVSSSYCPLFTTRTSIPSFLEGTENTQRLWLWSLYNFMTACIQ